MAVYAGTFREKNMEFMFMIDPNRYRVVISKEKTNGSGFYSKIFKVMVDKDFINLRKRLRNWIDKQPERDSKLKQK